ncbi:Uncharacterised protein [Vibrio cholerae]|nr:Uncharacterised protein [Vibrio cholerae]
MVAVSKELRNKPFSMPHRLSLPTLSLGICKLSRA